MIKIHHICGHTTVADTWTIGTDSSPIPEGYERVSADLPCPECQREATS